MSAEIFASSNGWSRPPDTNFETGSGGYRRSVLGPSNLFTIGLRWCEVQAIGTSPYPSPADATYAERSRSRAGKRETNSGSRGGDITFALPGLDHSIPGNLEAAYPRDVFTALPAGTRSLGDTW